MRQPFEHNISGAAFVAARKRALVGDTPGLAKTATAILALQQMGCTRPLVICPAVARTHWHREFDVMGWQGGEPRVFSFEAITNGGVRLMADLIHRALVDSLIVDEWTRVKHVTSQRAQLIASNNGYARRLKHVIALSGSKVRNAGEYYTILCALAPELLEAYGVGTREAFMARYTIRTYSFKNGARREKVVGQQNVGELQQMLANVQIKRDLGDVGLDVPKVFWQQWRIDGDSAFGPTGDGDQEAIAEVSHLLSNNTWDESLAEIANEPHIARLRRKLGELKAPVVARELAEQLAESDEQIVVFAHHRSVLHELREGLREFGVSYIDGDTSERDRDIARIQFQDGHNRVFLGQNIACQFSLTLTAASRVVLVEPDWTVDTNYQLGQRIARIGSTAERCIGQLVVLSGTLDEAIVAQNERELKMYEALHTGTQEVEALI